MSREQLRLQRRQGCCPTWINLDQFLLENNLASHEGEVERKLQAVRVLGADLRDLQDCRRFNLWDSLHS
eukprot:CAMPEP_0170511296 /NCGR_PEP_ID=MMETSP0208-20121228/66232_1 /TAXON_ID=197538 /ORGANISM="Strombidium inclinatum, Strain S3" /LENGTH=68 /DNA_ID=CAMNT_0010794829 /DNA_START=859 /DNA_END=1062 /DNA_ORIENTATION=+